MLLLLSAPCLHESVPRVVTKGGRARRAAGHPEVAGAQGAGGDHWGGDGAGHRGRGPRLGRVH